MPHPSVREIRQTLLLPRLPLPGVLTLLLPGVLGLPRVLTPPLPGVLTLPLPGGDLNLPPPGVHNLLLKRIQQIIKSMCCYQQKIYQNCQRELFYSDTRYEIE